MFKKLLTVGLFSLSAVSFADSLWDHNGSVMRLVSNGNARYFVYEIPSKTMQKTGVTQGALLFDGVKSGDEYQGTARVFSKYCAEPLTYSVSGIVTDPKTIYLLGERRVYAAGCVDTGKIKQDKLVFKYISTIN